MALNTLDRINELARISKERELTSEEAAEQQALRAEYIAGYRKSLRAHLDNIVLVDKDGSREAMKDRRKKDE